MCKPFIVYLETMSLIHVKVHLVPKIYVLPQAEQVLELAVCSVAVAAEARACIVAAGAQACTEAGVAALDGTAVAGAGALDGIADGELDGALVPRSHSRRLELADGIGSDRHHPMQ